MLRDRVHRAPSARGARLPGDVVLVVLSDEEAGGDYGAKFLVEEHPELFEGVRYALGEFGGFTLYVGGRRFYPIQVAEKQICWLKATVRGPGGHGALGAPRRHDARGSASCSPTSTASGCRCT